MAGSESAAVLPAGIETNEGYARSLAADGEVEG